MPEQLPAPSSVAGLASPVQRLHHPKPEEHALLCWIPEGKKERKKEPAGKLLLDRPCCPSSNAPTVPSSSVSGLFYMSKSHHACLSPLLSTFLKLRKQRDTVEQRPCIAKVPARSSQSQRLPSCLCSSNWGGAADTDSQSTFFPR